MSYSRRAVSITFVTALFLYFYSESVLRQSALSRLKSPKFSAETILSKLPVSIRNSARKSLELAKLKDAVKDASNDAEKVRAIVNLALAIDNNREKEKLFKEILRLPPVPESYPAFSYFLLDSRPEFTVSIKDYQKYINRCPKVSRFEIWNNGISALESKNVLPQQMKEYLAPLLNEPPPYRDYTMLYEKISDIALRSNDSAMLEKSGLMLEKASTRPPIFEEFNKKMEKAK
ncbi:MAG TPA: hypothetical protein DCZ94_06545 [Lentisphaeria bacterium]|nr:MAG: hypothetical protein A2X48_10835 [Lentisphaerae bacterium GWF2_49_21]HBC86594.1 hypothetical protein [Lentisphaeria bacterium]